MSSQKESLKDWRSAHEINPWIFPLPAELVDDNSYMAVWLRKLPVELIRDASRCPQPWKELALNQWIREGDPGGVYSELFAAIGSVLPAAQGITRTLYRADKTTRKLQSGVGDSEEELSLQRRLFSALWRFDREKLGRELELEPAHVQELHREMEERLLAQMQKRGGPRTDEATNERDSIERSPPIQYLLLSNWIRFGPSGDPGLCLYSDNAILALLGLLGYHKSSSVDGVRHFRIRIGLKQANAKDPHITGARQCQKTGRILLSYLPARTRRTASAGEWIPLRSTVVINGVIRYKGLPPSTEPGGGPTH